MSPTYLTYDMMYSVYCIMYIPPVSHLALFDPADDDDPQSEEEQDAQTESQNGEAWGLHFSQFVPELLNQLRLELLLRAERGGGGGGGGGPPPGGLLTAHCGPHSGGL